MDLSTQMVKRKKWNNQFAGRIGFFFGTLIILSFFYFHAADSFKYSTQGNEATVPVELIDGIELKQGISGISDQSLLSFSVFFGTYQRENKGEIYVTLYEDENIVCSWNISATELLDNTYKEFMLDSPLIIGNDHNYSFGITELFADDNAVAVWTNDSNTDGYNYGDQFVGDRIPQITGIGRNPRRLHRL